METDLGSGLVLAVLQTPLLLHEERGPSDWEKLQEIQCFLCRCEGLNQSLKLGGPPVKI